MKNIVIREETLTDEVLSVLLSLSKDWEKEQNVYGYRANERSDIEGNRIFFAYDGETVAGYCFGNGYASKNMKSVMPEGTKCFEVEELYVVPAYRSKGIGKRLMDAVCEAVRGECDYITLATATKNCKAILHFYIEEVGMTFWSARLFKKI